MNTATPALAVNGPIRPYSLPGLSSCLEEGRLRQSGRPFLHSPLDVDALRLAEWAFGRRRGLVLMPADPLVPLATLVAAAVHVADMAAFHKSTGNYGGSSRRVVVVTRDHRLRGFYRGLGVSAGRGSGSELLRAVVPAATLGRGNAIYLLESSVSVPSGWSTLFVPSVDAARRIRGDLVVVELPADGQDQIAKLRAPVVLVARDPADAFLRTLPDDVAVYAWSEDDVRALQMTPGLPPRLAQLAAGVECGVMPVGHQQVCENGALFWADIGQLVALSRSSPIGRELAREAFTLFHDLMGLAVPTELYEQAMGPMRVRLQAISTAARLTAGEIRDLYIPMVAEELRGLTEAIGQRARKVTALEAVVERGLDERLDVMVVARTAMAARLVLQHLRGHPRLDRVRVTSIGAVAEEAPADLAVLTGMAPSWARWIYRSGIAHRVCVLAYTPEGPVESVARGFDEAEIARVAVAQREQLGRWFARPAMKARAWALLSGDTSVVTDDQRSAPMIRPEAVPMLSTPPLDVPPGLWDGDRWLVAEPRVASSPDGTFDTSVMNPTTVSAVRVTFEDGRWALLDSDGVITRLKPGSGLPDTGYQVARLQPGDEILFLDGTSQKDLLTKVLEVAEEVPALAMASAWVSHWRKVLGQAYSRYGNYGRLAGALRMEGCGVQDQTIRLWVIGATIGPDDPEDVIRVGKVMQDRALLEHHGEVCRAMRSLRSAHVRLGRRLSQLARHVGAATAGGKLDVDEVIDERSGLTAADFQDSIDVVSVRAIEPVGLVPAPLTGVLHQDEEKR